jgi:hypothetical protein
MNFPNEEKMYIRMYRIKWVQAGYSLLSYSQLNATIPNSSIVPKNKAEISLVVAEQAEAAPYGKLGQSELYCMNPKTI